MNEIIKQNVKNNAIADFLGMNWAQLKGTNKGTGQNVGVMTPDGDVYIIKLHSELEKVELESDVITHFHHGWHWFQIKRIEKRRQHMITKNSLSRVIAQALYNLKKLPEADHFTVKRIEKNKKDHLLDMHKTAMKIIQQQMKEGFYD